MSPPLVVAFALAGRVDIDLTREPLGKGRDGRDVFLRDIWPTLAEVKDLMQSALKPEVYRRLYTDFASQNPKWNEIPSSAGETYAFDPASTYIQEPPFFAGFSMQPGAIAELAGARALGVFGDSVTTDHISPAGSIKKASPAGQFLLDSGVAFEDFNSYGSRRGNDRVMTRGTFANVRIKNLMLGGEEGGNTLLQPEGTKLSIFDAAGEYRRRGVPLVIIAGQEYGTGSSRDWAAKGTNLLGVKAVVAQSFERIHRSNLVGMGVLPLQFKEGTTAQTLGLDGTETYAVLGLGQALKPQQDLTLRITRKAAKPSTFRFAAGSIPPSRSTITSTAESSPTSSGKFWQKRDFRVGKAGLPGRRLFRSGGRPDRGKGELPEQRVPARFRRPDDEVREDAVRRRFPALHQHGQHVPRRPRRGRARAAQGRAEGEPRPHPHGPAQPRARPQPRAAQAPHRRHQRGGEPAARRATRPLVCGDRGELENARLVLEAHENLVAADETNRGKFQDVLVFMKNRVEQG
jgi:hypothetical protein